MALFLPRALFDFPFFQAAKLSSNQSLVNTNKLGNIPASYPLFVMVTSKVMRPLFLVPWHLTACFIDKWPISWSWIWHQEMALIVDNQLLACHAGEYQQLAIVKILQRATASKYLVPTTMLTAVGNKWGIVCKKVAQSLSNSCKYHRFLVTLILDNKYWINGDNLPSNSRATPATRLPLS